MNPSLSKVEIRDDRDVVVARQRAQTIAARLGFEAQDQTRIAAAVSEIARNAVRHAGGGQVEFGLEGDPAQSLKIQVVDQGPGLPESPSPVEGAALNSVRGMDAARRLMDGFEIASSKGSGCHVAMTKALPKRASLLTTADANRMAEELTRSAPPSAVDELLHQNRELLRTLADLRAREIELAEVNRELEETNRGVVALYVELDERAESLKQASEMKTRFLASVSHELRTPLSSILSLSRLLIDRADGDLTHEQERQVSFILRAGYELTGMVNDLLDLARVESGREVVRLAPIQLTEVFGALRGMLRPLQAADSPVAFLFDDPGDLPTMYTDEGKLAQILRNFLSNALKFTERGEIRLSAKPGPDESIVFSVSDTGIGIPPAYIDRIFEEFAQIDSPLQRTVKGTGLGLPLTRRFAKLLGGRIDVRSEPGVGSTFSATIPIRYSGDADVDPARPSAHKADVKEVPIDE